MVCPHNMTEQSTVLIIDDHDTIRELARAVLESDNMLVSEAHDGPAALRLAMAHTYDVILVDLRLPGMTGIEVVAHLRSRDGPNRHSALVAFTAESNARRIDSLGELGFDALLTKPIIPEKMISVVARLAQKRPTNGCTSSDA